MQITFEQKISIFNTKCLLSYIFEILNRGAALATVKANTSCMLSMLGLTGDGASAAGNWQKREEALMSQECQAFWQARISGHSIVRKGRFWLD